MQVTIKDVAKEAGVSIATVSRVFNGYDDISEETRKRIFQIAKEMKYIPNAAARTLSSKSHKSFMLLLSDYTLNRKDSLSMEILSGVYCFTEERDISFEFWSGNNAKQKEKTFFQLCGEKNVTGAIIQGLRTGDIYYQEISENKIPTVLIDVHPPNTDLGFVSIDNVTAAKSAVDTLVNLGHRNIAFINGRKEATVCIDREAGYLLGLQNNNLPHEPAYIQYANFSEDIAQAIVKDLIISNPEITAIFCASDLMASGVMKALKKMDLRIPEDISVFGFDNIALAEHLTPPLSSIGQNMYLMGYEAAKLLNKMIDSKKSKKKPQHQILLPYEIIVRESIGPCRTG